MQRVRRPAVEDLVNRLRKRLRDFVILEGAKIGGNGRFNCLNPDHSDSVPSMHIVPGTNDERVHCFSCGFRSDIFGLYAARRGTPAGGKGWLTRTAYSLARDLKEPFEEVELSEEEQHYLMLSTLMSEAADVFMAMICDESKRKERLSYPMGRGLTAETCCTYGVGIVPWNEFAQKLQERGQNLEFADAYGVNSDMFGNERCTFVLKDEDGAVVGFARRYLHYDKQAHKLCQSQGKYYPQKFSITNTSTSKMPVSFFQRDRYLYGMDTAKKFPYRRLDILEGYFDVLWARQAGHKTAVASIGTELSLAQVEMAKSKGFSELNLVYDVGDTNNQGLVSARKNLDRLAGTEGVSLLMTQLVFPDDVPPKDRDPDTFFRLYGLDAFMAQQPHSAFEWRLWDLYGDEKQKLSGTQIAEVMLPHVVGEKSLVRRGEMVKTLASYTQVSEENLLAEVARLEDKGVDTIADETAQKLRMAKNSKQRREIIANAEASLEALGTSNKDADLSEMETHKKFLEFCSGNEVPRTGLLGWKTGWDIFDRDFDGWPKSEQVIGVGGSSNSGKSAWLTTVSAGLLVNNPELTVIFHIVDDPRTTAFVKFLSACSKIPIDSLLHADRDLVPDPVKYQHYIDWRDYLAECIRIGRLVIKGQEMGSSTKMADKLIEYTKKTRDAPIAYMCDSLHGLEFEGASDERIKYKRIAEWASRTAETQKISMGFTMEVDKMSLDGRPSLKSIIESSKIQFAFKAIGLVYNELHDRENQAKLFWVDQVRDGSQVEMVPRAIMEVRWAKNKIRGFKETHYYKFHDHKAYLEEQSKKDLQQLKVQAASFRRANPTGSSLTEAEIGDTLPSLDAFHGGSDS